MKLQLNLSTTPQENRRPFLAAATLIGAIGLVALVILSQAAFRSWRSNRQMHSDISRLESEIEASSRQQQELENYFRTPEARKVLDRANFLNSLIGERSFPWTKIFADLEETLPAGVRVVNISPKLVDGRAEVLLTIGAASDEQKIHFLEAIEKSKAFSDIHVTAERRMDQAGAADRIVLDLSAVYAIT
ncbi:MAG TPA: hypothetical protein VLY23_14160 [Candidatus Acidoferrum sp.]|nr:hypothetical protein [Candidatus Acidoferrum sp.]